jgi:uroporphyrinogen decarboxylase
MAHNGGNEARRETMVPHERMAALMQGKKPDRVPFIPMIFGFCAKIVGDPVSTIYTDPEKSFFAQLHTAEMFGYDASPLFGYASMGAWEFGGDIKMPSSRWEQAPTVTRTPVQNEKDVDKLKLPDVETAGIYPTMIAFCRIAEKVGTPITWQGGGVFTTAGNIAGVDRLCRWMIKKPEVAHKMMRITTDHLLDSLKYWVDHFPVERILPFLGDPSAANQLISPKQFEEFVLPYQKELNEKILDAGIPSIFYHICGEQNLNLPHWQKMPYGRDGVPGILSFGHEVDLDVAIEMFGDEHIIAGNVEPRVIQNGSGQEVYDLTVETLKKGMKARRYLLMSGCDIPVEAPPYNIYMMMKALRDHGFYN